MLKLGTLFYDIKADASGLDKVERDVTKSTGSMEAGFNKLGGAILAAFGIHQVAQIVMLADELRVAERRIEILSDGAMDAANNIGYLKQVANETGQAFGDVFKVFEGFKRIQDDIGVTNEEILVFTDSLSKLGKLGGSSGEELAGALRQLNQGLAGGILRAEEFNSIIENTPEIALAIAKGLNTSLGGLRAMVLEGTLLADEVFNAILSQADKTNERFNQIPKSLGQLAQETKNILIDLVGELDKTTGTTSALSSLWEATNRGLQQLLDKNKELSEQDEETNKRRREVLQAQIVLAEKRKMGYIDQIRLMKEEGATQEQLIPFLKAMAELDERIVDLNEQKVALVGRAYEIEQLVAEEAEATADAKIEILDTTKGIEVHMRLIGKQFQNLMPNTEAVSDDLEDMDDSSRSIATNMSLLGKKFKAAFAGSSEPIDMSPIADLEAQFDSIDTINETRFADIEAQYQDHYANIKRLTEEGSKEQNRLLDMAAATRQMLILESTSNMLGEWGNFFDNVMSITSNFNNGSIDEQIKMINESTALSEEEKEQRIKVLEQEQKKRDKIMKIAFAFKKAVNVAEIAMDTAKNVIAAGGLTPMGILQGIFGGAQAAVVATQPMPSSGRVMGGNVGPNSLTPVTENGDPEMLRIGSQQYLMTGSRGGRVTSGADMASGGSGVKIIINNNAPGVEVEQIYATKEEVAIMVRAAEKSAVNSVNRSISNNQGGTARALRSSRSRG